MHKAILDAIVDRDDAGARLAMQKLIDYSRQTVLQIRAQRRGRVRSKTPGAKAPPRQTRHRRST